ncbi:unnamed protein product [Adineta steineri]|uniref:Secreted protein n=1 Tax=Adineta steineri TaxID=433720 RepID=A0A814NEK7_9BILA|nr:unnamed protein product [Adineta steineri]CAF1089455.1 unnamed protein product [Adineta steineri]CAF1407500.1 unnamed protein product [Adineta steineri]CAF3598981.1 unnamed protein product [Adineta steineri]CAF4295444.1 unnamed protein product [Adineta steineri]
MVMMTTTKILILALLISSFILTDALMCQCKCCRYLGPLFPNNRSRCACDATNQGEPFECGGSTGIHSARVCTTKIRPHYAPNAPNLCCQLTFL